MQIQIISNFKHNLEINMLIYWDAASHAKYLVEQWAWGHKSAIVVKREAVLALRDLEVQIYIYIYI